EDADDIYVRESHLSNAWNGDRVLVKIIKEGKEATQGVGYLGDGTMVVVEDGRSYVGDETKVTVTSALQTSAGRMILPRLRQRWPSLRRSPGPWCDRYQSQ
ncbi:MAG: TRAM domain-containing protein, partial [Synechococcales cyanobacterium CRU_2_2]|nr:TRAM domain-containing protein [Synechococcales cyanobacterium CRU_2_2]